MISHESPRLLGLTPKRLDVCEDSPFERRRRETSPSLKAASIEPTWIFLINELLPRAIDCLCKQLTPRISLKSAKRVDGVPTSN